MKLSNESSNSFDSSIPNLPFNLPGLLFLSQDIAQTPSSEKS